MPVILALAVGVASATGAWLFQENRYERQLSDLRADQATALADANANALAETQRLQKAKDDALKQAAVRQAGLARDARSARAAADGLRDQLNAAARSLPGATCDAARDYATAANDVFGQCAAAITELAQQADGHASDALTLQQAWPR